MKELFSLGYLHVTTCSWLCAQCQPCATPEALSESAFPTGKRCYARDKNVCLCGKLRLRVRKERLSGWQTPFTHVIKMFVWVAKTVYTCDKGVCRCVKVSLFVCKERLRVDRGHLHACQERMSG